MRGEREVIAIRPKALLAEPEGKLAEKPKANGKTNALEIGPEATLPESKAIAEKSGGVKSVRTKINKYEGIIKYQILKLNKIFAIARETKHEVPKAKAKSIMEVRMLPSEISSTWAIKAHAAGSEQTTAPPITKAIGKAIQL